MIDPKPSPIALGRYRHYKGNEYTVLGVARHSETRESLVVYRAEYGERGIWVRPVGMFRETVTVAGQTVPRFQHLEDPPPADTNLLANLPTHLPAEIMTTILSASHVRIERIVSVGNISPPDFWYDQDQHEWVLLLTGSARLQFEDRSQELKSGDHVNIPAHVKHRVEWTTPVEPTVWLAVYYN